VSYAPCAADQDRVRVDPRPGGCRRSPVDVDGVSSSHTTKPSSRSSTWFPNLFAIPVTLRRRRVSARRVSGARQRIAAIRELCGVAEKKNRAGEGRRLRTTLNDVRLLIFSFSRYEPQNLRDHHRCRASPAAAPLPKIIRPRHKPGKAMVLGCQADP
jgi:hypothetical protein